MSEYEKEFKFHFMVFVHEIDPSIPDTSGALAALHSGDPLPEGVIMKC